jgi:hypothetical protein
LHKTHGKPEKTTGYGLASATIVARYTIIHNLEIIFCTISCFLKICTKNIEKAALYNAFFNILDKIRIYEYF